MSIYQEIILDHYKNPRNSGLLENPTDSISVQNPLCGDTLVMQIIEENGIITRIGYNAAGCAISVASASLLSEYLLGKSKDELKNIDKQFMIDLIGIELSPNRMKCALLPWEAAHKLTD